MKLPLQRAELIQKWGLYRFTLACVAGLLFMLVTGYQLAQFQQKNEEKVALSEKQTRQYLEDENAALRKQVAALQVESVMAASSVSSYKKMLEAREQQGRSLEEQLSFYQRVVAPEVTQDGFFIDGIQVSPLASDNRYRIKAVLLQQNENKAMLKGELAVLIKGSLGGKPHEIKAGEGGFLPNGNIKWGFKFFQTVDEEFTLPAGFIPVQIVFSTEVFQWKSKRGEYVNSVNWIDVYDSPPEEGSQDS